MGSLDASHKWVITPTSTSQTGRAPRWLGSLADVGHPAALALPHPTRPGCLSAANPRRLRGGPSAPCSTSNALATSGSIARPAPVKPAWPWIASTSGDRHADMFWFVPDPDPPDDDGKSATGPHAELPAVRDTSPTTATFAWNGFGIPGNADPDLRPRCRRWFAGTIWLAAARSLAPAVPPRASSSVDRRWPPADLTRPAGPRGDAHPAAPRPPPPRFHGLPKDAPFACERIVVGLAVPGQTPTTAPRTTTPSTPPSCSTFLETLRAARPAPKSGG
ncbi:hypothetical protein SAMN05192558_104111 [Actinokineospora alba]|uniref:Uncharacterized protein n=1 Tax=Actinokineospora alba TaxID=504798 RepID=A0A1H0LEG7_9PSEU|nr:hypothetical protein C8E96_2830 [Actinokineospora alba]SDJ01530.1 hypothetical protein SAMN05421871_109186 [Actinokineospora alba]SDO66391.1 hypothetical protein SAMN05192558_104111 [Actinokineospora alba]